MKTKASFTFAVLVFVYACCPTPDLAKERQEILELLQQEQRAHLEKNVDLFMSEFADGMIAVNRGSVVARSEAENRERIGKYFSSVDFVKWDDVQEPVISLSADGTMAYAIVQKEVILAQKDSTGKVVNDTTHFAWVSIYRKQSGNWKVECNVSTNR